MVDFISLFRLRHSWIWSDMCVDLSCRKEDNRSVSASYRTGSWKWFRITFAKSKKLSNTAEGNSIYHFAAILVKFLWTTSTELNPHSMSWKSTTNGKWWHELLYHHQLCLQILGYLREDWLERVARRSYVLPGHSLVLKNMANLTFLGKGAWV